MGSAAAVATKAQTTSGKVITMTLALHAACAGA